MASPTPPTLLLLLLLLLLAPPLTLASSTCTVSLTLPRWPRPTALPPIQAKVTVGTCLSSPTPCDLTSTSGTVLWYNASIISYSSSPNAPLFPNFTFTPPSPPAHFIFAATATVFVSAPAPPYYLVYTFHTHGPLREGQTSATDHLPVGGDEGDTLLAFHTLFNCDDECADV